MTDKWINRVEKEVKVIDDDNLPYFLVMNNFNYVSVEGICEISFIVSLDDDIAKLGGKVKLQRANSSRLITINADISIKVRPGTSIREPSISYPNIEPEFILVSGASYFPKSFNVSNGDRLKYEDYSWNSNVYICDVIAGIATQVRRSIRSGNLSLVIERKGDDDDNDQTSISSSENTNSSEKEELMDKMKRLKELRSYLRKAKEKAGAAEDEFDSKEDKENRKLKKLRGIMKKTLVDDNDSQLYNTDSFEDSSVESLESLRDNEIVESEHRNHATSSLRNSIKEKLSLDVIKEEDEISEGSSRSNRNTLNSAHPVADAVAQNIAFRSNSQDLDRFEENSKNDRYNEDKKNTTEKKLEGQSNYESHSDLIASAIVSATTVKYSDDSKNIEVVVEEPIHTNQVRISSEEIGSEDMIEKDEDVPFDERNHTESTLEQYQPDDFQEDMIHVPSENELEKLTAAASLAESFTEEVLPDRSTSGEKDVIGSIESHSSNSFENSLFDEDTENDCDSYEVIKEKTQDTSLSPSRPLAQIKEILQLPNHTTDEDLIVGNVINISHHPFDKAHGLFRCKLMKRPAFMKDLIKNEEVLQNYLAAVRSKRNPIFRDTHMVIIDDKIVEVKRPTNHLLWTNKAKIIVSFSILSLLKVEYCLKRNILSLYFKEGLKDPLEYETDECVAAATKIHKVMETLGIHGKYRTPNMEKARRIAVYICLKISNRQKTIFDQISIGKIRELINMYTSAAEKFEYGLDDRRKIVIQQLNKFVEDPRIKDVLVSAGESVTGVLGNLDDSIRKSFKSSDNSSTRHMDNSSNEKSSRSLDESTGSDSTYDSEVENDLQSKIPQLFVMRSSKRPNKFDKVGNMERIPFQRRIVV